MRKGQGMFLGDAVALFLIAFLLVIYWFALFPEKIIPGNEEQSISAQTMDSSQITFMNFLRSPVVVEGKTIPTYELIADLPSDKSLEEPLREHMQTVFSKVYGFCYDFIISNEQGIIFQERHQYPQTEKYTSTILLPLADKKILTVSLDTVYFVQAKEKAFEVCNIP